MNSENEGFLIDLIIGVRPNFKSVSPIIDALENIRKTGG